jgi:hypothetical protein
MRPFPLRASRSKGLTRLFFLQCAFVCATPLSAQQQPQTSPASLPDAPTPQPDQTAGPQKSDFKAAIGILGKRSLFFPELAHDRRPLSVGRKLELAVDESIAPSQFLGSAFTSAINQARNAPPGYGQGWDGYGKRFGSSVATNSSSQMFGTFLLPSALHQDPRYFVKVFGSTRTRILYAISRIAITRTDGGRDTFNWSGVMGALMAEGLANSYLPDRERTPGKTFERYGVRLSFSALDNVVKEYWPTIFRSLRISKLLPGENSDPSKVSPPIGPPAPPQR